MCLLFVLKGQCLYIAKKKEEILLKLQQRALSVWKFWISFLKAETFLSFSFILIYSHVHGSFLRNMKSNFSCDIIIIFCFVCA